MMAQRRKGKANKAPVGCWAATRGQAAYLAAHSGTGTSLGAPAAGRRGRNFPATNPPVGHSWLLIITATAVAVWMIFLAVMAAR